MKATLHDLKLTPSCTAKGHTFYGCQAEVAGERYTVGGSLGHDGPRPFLSIRARVLDNPEAPILRQGDPVRDAIREALFAPLGIVAECGACHAVYTAGTWAKLALVGNVDGVLEQRNCACGSTCSAEIWLLNWKRQQPRPADLAAAVDSISRTERRRRMENES